jgi:hypothetical protein
LQLTLDNLAAYQAHKVAAEILASISARNIFYAQTDSRKQQLVDQYLAGFSYNDEGRKYINEALSKKPYAPYLLLSLIDKETFRKTNDFTYFKQCIDLTTKEDLEQLSKNP